MALKQIGGESGNVPQPDDLPWANVWKKTNEDYNSPRPVWMIIEFDTGLMVMCHEYKGYIHDGTTVHEQLLEALEVFHADKQEENLMVVRVNRKGKIEVLLDDEVQCHRWYKTENRFVQLQKGDNSTEPKKQANPLLAGRGVQTRVPVEKSDDGRGAPNIPAETPRKGRKTGEAIE
jgi:hypothetical protein